MACTVVQCYCKANSQSNENGQITTPSGSETPEPISIKHRIYNYIAGMTLLKDSSSRSRL